MMNTVYLNGKFIPKNQATISIMDRGFLFADSVYEVIPVRAGKMIGHLLHLSRLENSLRAIHMEPPLSQNQWCTILEKLMVANAYHAKDINFYIQVSRGADEKRDHAIPSHITPTVFVCCMPAKTKSLSELKLGFKAITVPDRRRDDCFIKSTALLPNLLAYHEAKEAQSFEAILIRDGHALEGTSSNLFIVMNNTIITPPITNHILSGITRTILLKLAHENHIAFKEEDIQEKTLFKADEIWLTGSTKDICPITILNNQPVGDGKVGKLWEKMFTLYQNYKCKNATHPEQNQYSGSR